MTANSRRDTLVLIAGMFVAVGLYVVLFWIPHGRNMAQMQGAIAGRRADIDRERSKLARLAALHNELDTLETDHREMTERVSAALNFREFHAAVHEMCERHGVTLSSDTPQIAIELFGFQQQPATITLTGRYHGVVAMINDLESKSPLVEVTDVELKPTNNLGDPDETLDVKVDLKLFARPAKIFPQVKN